MGLDDRITNESYTVFALPFAYFPTPLAPVPNDADSHWAKMDFGRPCVPDNDDPRSSRKLKDNETVEDFLNDHSAVWRSAYIMPETDLALFERAEWFELAGDGPLPRKFSCCPKDRPEAPVSVDWARLVLFEYPKESGDAGDQPACNGILLVKLFFPEGATLAHLLWLNEAFRYYKMPFWDHRNKLDRSKALGGLIDADTDVVGAYRTPWVKLLGTPVWMGSASFISLFPKSWNSTAERQALIMDEPRGLATWADRSDSSAGESGSWDAYPDNRVFVWTCAVLENGGDLPDFSSDVVPEIPTGHIQDWHALLNVDSKPNALNDFSFRWLKERTYTRWAHFGTLYGFNNYSAAMMTSSTWPYIWHFETTYLDMILLLLQVRTSLFRFSRRISKATHLRTRRGRKYPWVMEFCRLRESFASFVNLFQFPLIGTQQQGIEMYTLARRWLDVDDLFAEVKTEIETTHEFADMVNQGQLNRGVATLSTAGIGLALGALVAGLFSTGDYDVVGVDLSREFWTKTAIAAGGAVVGGLASWAWVRLRHTGR